MDKIIIWGATGQAAVINELLAGSAYSIEALFDNNASLESPLAGVPLFVGLEGLEKWESGQNFEGGMPFFVAAIGGANGEARANIGTLLKERGYRPLTLVHRTAFVASDASVGEGCQILANSSICTRAVLGAQCIINTGAQVDHECILSDNVHIAPGATLAGKVIVEENVFIGTNATVLPHITIGKHAVVGAGAVVIRDVPAFTVVAGNPAVQINQRQAQNSNH